MERKKLMLIVAIVIVIAVAAVAASVYLVGPYGAGGGSSIAGASSLRFSVMVTHNETSLGNYTFMVKNAGTMRIETKTANTSIIYIVDGYQQKAWLCSNGTWQDLSDAFTTQWTTWSSQLKGYTDNLAGWKSGNWTYTTPNEDTVKIYDIAINPSLADSLFQPS
jgi:outer membrane lipoprotein-sorting protein